ncbi:hypothetical protein BH10ACT11_BH10ACT11_01700 [soil metagenome]
MAAGPALGAGHHGPPKVSLKVKTTKQSQLVESGKVTVGASSKDRVKPKLTVSIKQGAGKSTKASKAKSVSVKGSKTADLQLNSRGQRLVQSCIPTTIKVTAKRGKTKLGFANAKMQRSAARCDGSKPTGIDLDNADRCDFIDAAGQECLFPYPNDYYTRKDTSTDTGLRLNLSSESTPANTSGVHIDPADLNASDGFSPGAMVVLHVPGLDNPAAFQATNPVAITGQGAYKNPSTAVVLIDAATGERQPIWTALASTARSAAQTSLLIHPAKNLTEGHRYIVAMRHLSDASGDTIPTPKGFRLYRDDIPTNVPAVESRRKHFESLFDTLGDSHVQRKNLYLAWDFTVASTRDITERQLDIRDRGLAELGDMTPGDGIRQGHAPTFDITTITDYPISPVPTSGRGVEDIRQIEGTIDVPCYLNQVGCPSGSRFDLDSNGLPERIPGNTYKARFGCNIPRSAVQDDGGGETEVADAALPTMYGHGLFGQYTEGLRSQNVRQLGTENNVIVCSADFIGMADEDEIPEALPALLDMSKFEPLPDRLQQGFLDFIYLGRALSMPDGFASDPAFQFGGESALDPSSVSYYGNSQGGIAGGALTAIEPDVTRSVLYVPGMNYGGLLLTRSIDFGDFSPYLYGSYTVEQERPLLLSMIQSQWDRGEPNGYANHMTTDPLPGTPEHHVMLEMSYGDHQVANAATEVEARTIGAKLHQPALDANRPPPGFSQPLFGIPTLGSIPGPDASGNGMFVWDIGPKRDDPDSVDPADVLGTDPPPNGNTAPDDSFGVDPHDTVIERSPLIRKQIADFIKPGGSITDPCGLNPCYAAGFNGSP